MNQITQEKLNRLNSLLSKGDRGRVYLELAETYKPVSSNAFNQIIQQAQITTYSGVIGGAAILGNFYAKNNAGSNSNGKSRYDVPLDVFSVQIIKRLLDATQLSLNRGGNGILTIDEIRALDYSVWNDKGIGHLFPGNLQGRDIKGIPKDSVVYNYLTKEQIQENIWTGSDLLDHDSPAFIIGVGASAYANGIGKQLSDYGFSGSENLSNNQIVLSEDNKYSLEINKDGLYIITNKKTGFAEAIINPDASLYEDFWLPKWFLKVVEQLGFSIISFPKKTALSPETEDSIKNHLGADLGESGIRNFKGNEVLLKMYCFSVGTPILMSSGSYKSIEDIKIGDEVMAFDGLEELQPCKVINTFITPDQEVVQLGDIRVTPGHQFLLLDGTFQSIGEVDSTGFLVGVTGQPIPHPGIKPVPGKHTVYNFTVEGLHTYVAGDYRVHNESLSLYRTVTPGGAAGRRAGDEIASMFTGNSFASQLAIRSLGKTLGGFVGDAIDYEFVSAAEKRDPLELAALLYRLPQELVSTGIDLGSAKLTEELAELLGIDDSLTKIGIDSLISGISPYYLQQLAINNFGEFGEDVAIRFFGAPVKYVDNPQNPKNPNVVLDRSQLSLERTLQNTIGNFVSASVNFGSNRLANSLIKEFKIEDPLAQIGATSLTNAVVSEAFTALAIKNFGTTTPLLSYLGISEADVARFNNFSSLENIGARFANIASGALGSFAGSWTYSQLVGKWNVLSEDISASGVKYGSAIGGSLAGLAGGITLGTGAAGVSLATSLGSWIVAGSFAGPVGIFVMAAVGTLLGSMIGGEFGDKDYPRSAYKVILDPSTGTFTSAFSYNDDGATPEAAQKMGEYAKDLINMLMSTIGGRAIQSAESVDTFNYGYRETSYIFHLGGPNFPGGSTWGAWVKFDAPDKAIAAGVIQQLRRTMIEGGDLYMKRLIANISQVEFTYTDFTLFNDKRYIVTPRNLPDISLEKLNSDLLVAKEYGIYLDNPVLYDRLIANVKATQLPQSEEGILAMRAKGERPAFTADAQFYNFDTNILPSQVTLQLSGNDLIVNGQRLVNWRNGTTQQTFRFADGSLFKPVINATTGRVTLEPEAVANWLKTKQRAQELNLDTPTASDNYAGDRISKFFIGAEGDDILRSRPANETLEGKSGDDVYLYTRGSGIDTIRDNAGLDIIEFDTSIKREDLRIDLIDNALIITIQSSTAPGSISTDKIIIPGFSTGQSKIEIIRFSNGDEYLLTASGLYKPQTSERVLPSSFVPSTFNIPHGSDFGYSDLPRFMADVNGDGYADFGRFVGDGANIRLSFLLAGPNGFTTQTFNSSPGIDRGYSVHPRFMADVNGDGRADFGRFVGDGANIHLSFLLAGPNGFTTQTFNSAPGIDRGYSSARRFMADVNGDGRADFGRFVGDRPNVYLSFALAGANGITTQTFNTPVGVDIGDTSRALMADVNGDGRADFGRFIGSGATMSLSFLLAGPNGFTTQTFSTPTGTSLGDINRALMADVNGDGRADFGRLLGSGASMSLSFLLAGTNGFTSQTISTPLGTNLGDLNQLFVVDVNGDDSADFGRFIVSNGKTDLSFLVAEPAITLRGTYGADVIQGTQENEMMSGKEGDDTYAYNLGGGQDRIYDLGNHEGVVRDGGIDTIRFGVGIKPGDLVLELKDNDLMVGIRNATTPNTLLSALTDIITIKDWRKPNSSVEIFQFANGLEFKPQIMMDGSVSLQSFLSKGLSSPDNSLEPPEGFIHSLNRLAVFDLDGDGIRLTVAAQSSTQFDIDNDGYLEQTGWLDPSDAFLVYDRDNNGLITNPTEFFSLTGSSLVPALASLDSNRDGVVSVTDSLFSQLRFWTDVNQNGQTDLGELHALHRYEILEIGVNGLAKDYSIGDNSITSLSYFTRLGLQYQRRSGLYDVAFSHNPNGVKLSSSTLNLGWTEFDFENQLNVLFADNSQTNAVLVLDPTRAYSATGGTGNDILVVKESGNSSKSILNGSDGDDTLIGASGDDILVGGAGRDVINGNGGNDMITIDASDLLNQINGGDGFDTLIIEGNQNLDINLTELNFESIIGNGGNDRFRSSGTVPVVLSGGLGNDNLASGDGSDRLNGDAGNDILSPGLPGATMDLVDGGEGSDTLLLDYSRYQYENKGITSSESGLIQSVSGAMTILAYTGIEKVNITGTNFDDFLVGHGQADILNAGLGNDTYEFTLVKAVGATIRDLGGVEILNVKDVTLSLNSPALGRLGVQKDNTTLWIDLNQDGQLNPDQDLRILDFFNADGNAGDGFIEKINDLSTASLLSSPTNHLPHVTNPIADQTTPEDLPYRQTIALNSFQDLDPTDRLTYSASLSNNQPLPTWLSFDPITRTLSGTPADPAVLNITLTATDPAGASASDTFNLTITPLNPITGTSGNNQLTGTPEPDRLIGTAPTRTPGYQEIDTLTGNSGADLFVLGTRRYVFYDDSLYAQAGWWRIIQMRDAVRNAGLGDYGVITDFNPTEGDRIQLKGNANMYQLGISPIATKPGTAIFLTAGQQTPELIGIVQGTAPASLSTNYFTYV
jgi:Ca2+-binding RTX toxin-like protein